MDDVESVRNFVKHALERFGYQVRLASGGKEALEIIETAPESIDVVLLDLSMPELPGWQVWEQARVTQPDLRICLMSGFNEEIAKTHIPSENLEASFIQKPFSPRELADKLRAILDRPARHAEVTVQILAPRSRQAR